MKKKIEKIKKMKLWILPAPVILILAVMALGGVGFVGALNGWFGGGSAIPSDTFTRGLVGYWSFDESKGTTVYDSSGNSKNGTLNPCGGGTDNGNGTCTSTITWQVGASADDVSVAERNGAWNFEGLTDTWFFAGFYSSPALLKAGSGGRFLNVTIPQGATINSAVVKLTANGSSEPGSVTVNTRFIGEKVANAATFSTLADYQARRGTVVGGANNNYITSAQVDWDSIPVWTLDTEYTSPEVKTIIQEIVNQGTWSSGNALVLWWDDYDNRSTNSLYRFRNAYAYDGSAVKAAKLVMTYTYTLPSSWTTANPPTGGGSALKFDGAGNYVSAGNVYNGVKSVEFWVKADNTTKKILDLNGSAYVEVSNQTITATGWTSPTIYVNGVKNSTTISTSTWAHVIITTDTAIDASTVDLGRVSTGYFPGTLDEVRFYSRSLSDSEVRYHYNRGGPVAQWKFDEGEGRTVYDSTDNNNDGTLVLAGSATSSAWVAGKYGSALSFDGVDDYVDAGNVSSNARTVSFWLKRGNTSDKDVIDLGTPEIKISSNAITSTGLTSPTYYIDGVRATTIADTNWHHITITDTADISASNVDIGKASSNYFLGLIDDVKIYNYARTPDEIRLDYNAGFAALFGPQTGCDQDPGSCMTQGLVGYWPMEEGSGSVAHDSSNYGNNGSSTMASWTKGKVGSALDLDGAGDYISIPDNDIFDPSGDFTLSIWTKQDTFGGAGYWERSFIAHDTVGGVAVKWVFAHDGTKTAFDFIPPSLAIYELRSDAWTLSAGVWYQISVTRQGSTFTFYKDGVANGTVTNAVALGNNAQPLTIGWAEANKAYDGIIDEVRIYNRALSASEVRYHYNRGAPVAQWKFDEGNGAKVYDSTDNKNGAIRSSALNFDGVNDYVAIPDSNDWNFGSGDFTIETWAKFRSVAGTQNFVSQWGDSGSNGSFAFVLDVGATLMFFWSTTGSSELRVDGAWSPSINTWYYVTAIRSGTSIKTYVDTVEKGSGTLSGTIYNSTRNLDIGAYRDAGQIFNGLIDDVRIYNRALSVTEMQEHYKGKYANETGLMLNVPFNNEAGYTVTDYSGRGNNGTASSTFADMTAGYGDANNTGWAIDTSWQAGKYGQALKFGGTNGFFQTDNSVTSTSAFSYSLWFKSDKGSYAANQYLFSQGDDDPSVYIGTNGKLNVMTDNALKITSSKTVLDTNWHHVQVTADGSQLKLYLDGGFEGSTGYTGSSDDAGFTAGAHIYRTNFFNGYIDDVKIYNYARTPDEIRLDYNAGFAALFGPQTGCDQDPGSCMTQGLVGYWPMEEGSGSVTHDSSNYGKNGTLKYMATSTDAWTKGKVGGGLSFDGTNDYVTVGTDAGMPLGSANRTITGWFKTNVAGAGNQIVGYGTFAQGQYFLVQVTSNNLGVGTHTNNYTGTKTLSLNTWYHFAVLIDGANVKTFINGVADINTAHTNLNTVSGGKFYIGAEPGQGDPAATVWNGVLDEIRIYNRALSVAEIRYHYNRGNPVAQWKFDEGNGTKVYDLTGNNNNGAIRSSALNFDGTNDYVLVTNSVSIQAMTRITVEAWVKTNAAIPSPVLIVNKEETGGFSFGAGWTANKPSFYANTGSWTPAIGVTALQIGTWYHLVGTYDGANVKIYVNGIEEGSAVKTGDIGGGSQNTCIGCKSDTLNLLWNGAIDEVRVYNRALSAAEVAEHYKGKFSNETGLVLYLPFNDEAGTVAKDASGQGNNGTLSGFSITTPKYGDANNTGWVIDSDWQAGKYGNALKFGGANGFFQTNNSVTSTSAFSYSLWFKSGKGSYSANQYLFSQGDDDPSAYIGTNGKLNVMTDNALKITSSKTVLDTNWHHVQVTADGSNLKLYLDGGFEGSIGYTGSSEDAGFTAGADIYRNNFFNGYIDDVKIYNYARTPDEIRLDYNAGFAALFGPQTGCDQDPGSCMTQGLVGYWPMEEGSGNIAYDASNYAYNATTSGTAPNWTKGKVGGGLSFDGTDDLIQTSATVSFNSNNIYTAEAWIYPTASGDPKTFLSFGSSASGNQYVDEFSLRNLNLQFANYAGSWTASAGALSLNTWNHAVLIHDGANNNVKIYLNGVLGVDASYTTDLLTTTGAITAGALNTVTPGEYFAGRVDEVRIYNRALSAAEVRYHYNKGGPVAQWKFDEGEGTTAYDSTDNNNDGTLTSGPAWVAGKYGSALSFDGVNDYVSVADNNSLDITSAITISAWINPTKTGANRQVIVSKRVAQTNSSNYQFYIFGGEAGKVNFYNGVAEYEFNYAPPSNTWTHLVMTLDGTTGKLYANGALKDTKIFSFGAANAAPLTIGYFDHSTTDEIFSGFIDDVRIYNYVRTTEQIRQDYNAGLSTHFK